MADCGCPLREAASEPPAVPVPVTEENRDILEMFLVAPTGHHSISLREEDRHMTTFLTPWGCYRYTRAPQRYLASRDGYTHRYNQVTVGLRNIKRVINNTLLYGESGGGL